MKIVKNGAKNQTKNKQQTFENFKHFFTAAAADEDRRKNNATTGSSGYSVNTIEQNVHREMNNILQQWIHPEVIPNQPSTESAPNQPPTESSPRTESANTTTLEDIRDELIKLINNQQNKSQLPPYQGKINGENVTYCWSHGITKNRRHNSKTCKRKKEGHQDDATLNNRMGGSNERCKTHNNNSS